MSTFRPPQNVRSAAARGLKLREKWGRGGLSTGQASEEGVGSGVQRATNLKNGDAISLDTIRRMRSFFARHEKNYQPSKKENDGGPTKGTIAWLLWGGNAGRSWANRILRQEGVLKACGGGEVDLPAFLDLQLGPTIYAGVIKQDQDEVLDLMVKAEVCGSVCSYGSEASLVFFTKEDEPLPETLEKADFVADVEADDLCVVEDNRNRVTSLAKSAQDGVVGFNCYVTEPENYKGLEFAEMFLLKSIDAPPASILKVDSELGLVFGWAIISRIDGIDYFDKQDEHIPEDAMLSAATEFMSGERVQGEMHVNDENGIVKRGQIVFAWPLTEDIAKAFGIHSKQTGLMIAAKPDDPKTLEKFADGTYTGFSIGGRRIPEYTEEVDG